MKYGKVKHWRDNDGYGFVRPENGDKDYFVHVSVVERDLGREHLTLGERVAYEVGISPKSNREMIVKIQEA